MSVQDNSQFSGACVLIAVMGLIGWLLLMMYMHGQ